MAVLITRAPEPAGFQIVDYFDFIFAEGAFGTALDELRGKAEGLGANWIVDFDSQPTDPTVVYGTAVQAKSVR